MKRTIRAIVATAALALAGSAIPQNKDAVTASGKVLGTVQIRTSTGMPRELVKLQRPDGGTVVVDLGRRAREVREGEHLFVQGRSARISGKPVIFARYVGELREVDRTGEPGAAAGGSAEPGGELKYDDFGYFRDELEWTSDDPAFLSFYSDAENAWDAYRTRAGGDEKPVRR